MKRYEAATTTRDIGEFLTVGLPVVLNLPSLARYRVSVRGWQAGKYFIVDSPMQGGAPLVLRKGQPCVIRFIAEGVACGFSSSVVERASLEVPLIRLRWPGAVETIRIRKDERVALQTQCRIVREDGAEIPGEMCDISVGGCRVYARVFLAENSRCELSFVLPDGSSVDRIGARVCSVNKLESGGVHGLRFEKSQPESTYDIEFYVSAVLEKRRASGNDPLRRVLVIEADAQQGAVLRGAFERLGWNAALAAGVVDAFFRLRNTPVGCVMINCDMPDLPGDEICRVITKSRGLENVRVFLFGGDPNEGERLAIQAGADGYLGPCIDPYSLAQELADRMSNMPSGVDIEPELENEPLIARDA